MTTAGWIVMLLAIGGITALLGWCVHKVLATPGAEEHVHSQTNIDTHEER